MLPILLGGLLFWANLYALTWLMSLGGLDELLYGRGSWWLNESLIVKAAYVGVIAPFVEELLFRRLLLNQFINKKKAAAGLLLSSLLFGLWHMLYGWGPLKTADMFLVGLAFGLSYMKWGFKGSLLTHYTNNLMALLLMTKPI